MFKIDKQGSNAMKFLIFFSLFLFFLFSFSFVSAHCIGSTANFTCEETITQSCVMNESEVCAGTGFHIGAHNIVVNCNGYEINYSVSASGYGINNTVGFDNVTIKNCRINQITSVGTNSWAIAWTNGADNGTIENNTIVTVAGGGSVTHHGIRLINWSNNNLVFNNNVTTFGQASYGITFSTSSNNNSAYNNTIRTIEAVGHGIISHTVNNSNIFNNNITLTHTGTFATYGIWFVNSTLGNISNNNITTSGGNYSYAIYVQGNSNNSIFSNNRINSTPSTQSGIRFAENSRNNQIINNTVIRNAFGIHLIGGSASNNLISHNNISNSTIYLEIAPSNNTISHNIIINQNSSPAMAITGNNHTINNNIMNITGASSAGIRIVGAINNTLIFNNVITTNSTTCRGIDYATPTPSNNVSIHNNTITTMGATSEGIQNLRVISSSLYNNTIMTLGDNSHGLVLTTANNSNFSLMNISVKDPTTGAHGIRIDGTGNRFIDSIITSDKDADIFIIGTANEVNNFTNCTFNKSDVLFNTGSNARINVHWYLDVRVNYSNGMPVQGAFVTGYNNTNDLVFNQTTNATGQITRQTLLEYMQNITNRYFSTNYSVNATKNSDISNTTEQINLTTNVASQLWIFTNFPPQIILNLPLNNTQFNNTQNINFNFTAIDDFNSTLNCSIYLDGTLNQTNASTQNNTLTNFLINGISYGSHNWSINCSDGSLSNVSETRYFSINDTIVPSIYYNQNTDENGTYSKNWIFVNITCSDLNKQAVIFNWNGTNETFDNSVGDIYWENKTELDDGTYTFYAWCNDSYGNNNQTGLRQITLDTIPPIINYVAPTEINGTITNKIQVNVTASDNTSGLDNITIYLYNTTLVDSQTTSTSPNFVIFTDLADGTYYFNATACDKVNNCDSLETRTVTIETLSPSVTLESPIDHYTQDNFNISFNCSATDLGIGLTNISLWHNATGSFVINATNDVIGSHNSTIFNMNFSDGIYKWSCSACDSAGNCNLSSENRTFIIDTIPPYVEQISPMDGYISSSSRIIFNCSANDNLELVNISLLLNGVTKQTILVSGTSNFSEFKVTLTTASWKWQCQVCDMVSCNITDNRTLWVVVNEETNPMNYLIIAIFLIGVALLIISRIINDWTFEFLAGLIFIIFGFYNYFNPLILMNDYLHIAMSLIIFGLGVYWTFNSIFKYFTEQGEM